MIRISAENSGYGSLALAPDSSAEALAKAGRNRGS
jgi:hypothetical protein